MQEKAKVLEIIGDVLDVYKGKEIKVIEKEVEPDTKEVVVEPPVVEPKVVTPIVEPTPKVVPKVDEPIKDTNVVVEQIKPNLEEKVVETPPITVEEMVATAIAKALKPYQDEVTALKEENKGLKDTQPFGLQGRPTKIEELDADAFTVENIYKNS